MAAAPKAKAVAKTATKSAPKAAEKAAPKAAAKAATKAAVEPGDKFDADEWVRTNIVESEVISESSRHRYCSRLHKRAETVAKTAGLIDRKPFMHKVRKAAGELWDLHHS